jgi:hypothetical protein
MIKTIKVMSKLKLPVSLRRTSGLKVLENGRFHAVRYTWEEGLTIKELKDKGVTRLKSGIAIEKTPKDYLKNFLRGDSTGKKMIWWDDNFIDQNLPYGDAAKIIKLMDNIFKTIMKEEGFQSRAIHKDRSLGTEMYENDNYEELLDFIKHTWGKAYRIAYESVTKNELPNGLIYEDFSPRNMQAERMIDPVINYLTNNDKCTIEVPGGSGKSKCGFRISQLVCKALGLPWKVLGVGPNISITVQLCNEYSKFYQSQTSQRLLDLYIVGSVNNNDHRLLESWANVYSVSSDKLPSVMKNCYNSPRDCAFFVVNKSASDFLALANKIGVNFKNFFTILDEIHEYSRETGVPKMVTNSQCAAINPKYNHLFGKKLGLSATHILRPEHITDINAVYNDDLDKFGPCESRVTEIEARSFGWICDKQGVVIPIPTDDIFTNAISENAIFNIEMFGYNKPFNPITYVGVEGIRLLSYNNKILVLVSRRVDIAMIADVLRLYQDNEQLDNNFNIIEGYAECNNACINTFNKSKRAIMIATRWVGVGNDTYTCDCTLPLYNPESRAFVRQFGMRGDRVYYDKVTTFALVASESRLEDSPWFESLQMISNGEQLNIVSSNQFRQEHQTIIGGTRNVTLIRPERTERPEIALQWEEIMRSVSTKDYIDPATGKSRFSEIVYINYTPEMILDYVKEQGYTTKTEWQECPEGNKYYSNAHKLGCMDWVVEQTNLEHKHLNIEKDWNNFLLKNNFTNKNTKKEVTILAKKQLGQGIITKVREKGWHWDFLDHKTGNKPKVFLPKDIKQWIIENNLKGKPIKEATDITSTQNKSNIKTNGQKILRLYRKFLKEGKIEKLLKDNRSQPSRVVTKKILQFDLKENLIKAWNSFDLTKNSGYTRTPISSALNGRQKTAHGFIWKYEEDNSNFKLTTK